MERDEALNAIGIRLSAENLPEIPNASLNKNIKYDPFVVCISTQTTSFC
jgi:hypothetical protein